MAVTHQIDTQRAEAFAEELVGTLNHGAAALMISIGHRTGLFDKMAELPPSTSRQIAGAAKLNERYVREWLGAMATARIVEYDPKDKTYRLPPEHAAALTREAGSANMAPFMQYVAVLGGVEDGIVEAFRKGGGVPYEKFGRFHEVMAEDSGQSVLPALFDRILPLAPGMTERLEQGIDVLDLGCGMGRALKFLAPAFQKSRFVGYDFSEEAIGAASKDCPANLRFAVVDAAKLDEKDRYDFILTFDAIHDQKDPAKVLSNIHAALKPGGTYLMQDIAGSSHLENNLDHPMGTFLYTVSCMHCMTVSLALDGAGLGAVWGKELALKMLAEAGFKDVKVNQLSHDIQNYYYVMTKAG